MKIKCRFILIHDRDNDPLIINADQVSLINLTDKGNNSITFGIKQCTVNVTESVTKIIKTIQEAPIFEIDEFILLHDKNNDHVAVKVSDILNIFMLPKEHNAKAKIYFNEEDYLYVKENVNKIYSLLCGQTEGKTFKEDA